ncbi:hypothetical protein MAP00_004749 [Monascus purpureus]|nr:hypothetical protein MAP00_004749 [Monascus purpureus]
MSTEIMVLPERQLPRLLNPCFRNWPDLPRNLENPNGKELLASPSEKGNRIGREKESNGLLLGAYDVRDLAEWLADMVRAQETKKWRLCRPSEKAPGQDKQ